MKRKPFKLAFRRKKAGVTYYIEFNCRVNEIKKARCYSVTKGQYVPPKKDWEFKAYPFEADVDLLLDVDIESASSYYYGLEEPLYNVPILIKKVKGLAPRPEEFEDGEENELYWEPTKENVEEAMEHLFRKGEEMYFLASMGWAGNFVGTLDEVELTEYIAPYEYHGDSAGGIDKLEEISIPNQEVVDELEYVCSGQYYSDLDSECEIPYEDSLE